MRAQLLKAISATAMTLAAYNCFGMEFEKKTDGSTAEITEMPIDSKLEQARLASILFGKSWRVLESRAGNKDIPSLFTVSSLVVNTSGFCRRDQMSIDSWAMRIEEVTADEVINSETKHYFAFTKFPSEKKEPCKARFPEFLSSLNIERSVAYMRQLQDYLSDGRVKIELALIGGADKVTVNRDYLLSNIDSLSYTLDPDGSEFGVFTIRLDKCGNAGKELLVSIKNLDSKLVRLRVEQTSLPAL